MPAYNFQGRFAPYIESGRKRQTIRPKRKRPTRPGDTLYLFIGMRTKQCRKLGEAVCQDVTNIIIEPDMVITLGGRILGLIEANELARADGFVSLGEFYVFFEERYGVPHEVELELIKW